MGFGKAFGAGIGIFIGINVGLTALVALLIGIQDGNMLGPASVVVSGMNVNIIYWILSILGGVAVAYLLTTPVGFLSLGAMRFSTGAGYINSAFLGTEIFTALAWILVIALMFVGAIAVGYLSHSPGAGFGAMFLITAIITTIGTIGTLLFNDAYFVAMGGSPTTLDLLTIIQGIVVPIVVTTAVNGLALGAVAMGMGYKFEE